MKPWIEYTPGFLAPERAKAIFDWISTQNLKPETGDCTKPPTHDSIQWGPRQAYIHCVPFGVRIQSSGPIPAKLSKLHAELEQRYQAHFNSIQVNRHWDENSEVGAHSDLMHGHIVMLSLGAERRFVLRYKHDHKAKEPKWKAGDIYFDKSSANGSLLTIYKQHQFDLTHEMPKAEHPCGPRVSLIWRYLALPDTRKLSRDSLIEGQKEYQEAQAQWQEAEKHE
jgi:alkylated DNA repair dioxygenase AlkB